jgi:hypothetical protein
MNQQKNEPKEVDLLELFRIIGIGIKNFLLWILKSFLILIVLGIKKIHFILLAVIIGGLFGFILYHTNQRYYTSNLIAQPNGATASDMVEYINDLTIFCENSNHSALANALNLPEVESKKIKKIKAFRYIDVNKDKRGDIIDYDFSFNPKDTSQKIDEKRVYIEVEVFDNTVFNSVEEGLFDYVSKNRFFSDLNEIRKKELTELIRQTEQEILKLDSLQNVNYFKDNSILSTNNDKGLLFLSEKDKQMFYKDKLILVKQKQQYIKELELSTLPLTVIKDFAQIVTEETPKSNYILKFGFFFGLFGFVLMVVISNKKQIATFIKNNS